VGRTPRNRVEGRLGAVAGGRPPPADDTFPDDGVDVDTTQTARTPATGTGDAPDTWQAGPTVSRMALGVRLRQLREGRGLTREEAGRALGVSRSKISRLELGRTGCKAHDVDGLLNLYRVPAGPERSLVQALARQANIPGWWHEFHDVTPPWLQDYLGLEQAADVIRSFEVQYVPGLLQTADYARALVRIGFPDATAEETDRRVELRMRRQRILHRLQPPHLWVVVDEGALHRPLGGAAVMRAQLDHLMAVGELPHVTVQVLPFGAGGHPALSGPITMLRLPGDQLPDVVYLEQLTSAVYPDRPAEVHEYWDVLNRLAVDAERAGTPTRNILRGLRDAL
jgi:transcriptional regulator with XRE-family HTH domain